MTAIIRNLANQVAEKFVASAQPVGTKLPPQCQFAEPSIVCHTCP